MTALVESPAENLRVLMQHVAKYVPGSDVHQEPGFLRIKTGIPCHVMNGVFQTRVSHHGIADRIRETIRYFDGCPMQWMLEPSHLPHNIGSILTGMGFVNSYSSPAMVLDLQHFDAPEAPEELEIDLVRTDSDIADLLTVLDVFKLGPVANEAYAKMVGGMLLDRRFQHYVGRVNGQTVSIGATFFQGETVGLYTIATLKEMRGRGYGQAITTRMLQEGKGRGCRVSVLTSSKLGLGVYSKLGFEEVGKIPYFTLQEETEGTS